MKRKECAAGRSAAMAAWATAILAVSITASPALASEPGCVGLPETHAHETEARRAEQSSTYLPNCRAYEQVTPVAKDSGEPQSNESAVFEPTRGALAALNGDRMAWITEYPGLAAPTSMGLDYLSTRGPEGWRTEAAVPPQSPEAGLACPEYPGIVGWSRNLTKGILADGAAQGFSSGSTSGQAAFAGEYGCGHAEPELREADGAEIKEPGGFQNLFLRDNETPSYQLVNATPSTAPRPAPKEEKQAYFPPNFLAGSAHLENVAFEDELPLTEEAEKLSPAVEAACKEAPKGRACWEGHDDLYVWSEGQQPAVRLVTVLPDGKPVEGALAASTRNTTEPEQPGTLGKPINIADYRHAVSADGSRIFFEAEGNLYVRENGGQPQSTLGPKGECAEPARACTIQLDLPQGGKGTGGGGKWLGANGEGTKVFFTDEASAGLTASTQAGSGVNLYEYELPSEVDQPGALIDLTTGAKAEVVGMSGVSEDGSYLYFVAKGELTAGKDKMPGRSPEEAEPSEGADNLYIVQYDRARKAWEPPKFIATLNEKDECDWTSDTGCYPRELSNPGESGSTARVSGNGQYIVFNSVNELTGYIDTDSVTGKADEEIYLYEAEGNHLACVSCKPSGAAPSAGGATIDWPTTVDRSGNILRNAYPQRNVTEAGQVFFGTSEALLPREDTNGVRDVYEYEHGALHLISSGTSAAPSYFLDASASGSDVFFATSQKLLPRDTDSAYDIYDVRVGGGFPEPPPSSAPCESEECKATAAVPAVFSAPTSTTFSGPGDIAQAKTPPKPKPKKKKLKAKKTKHRRKAERRRALSNGHRHGHRRALSSYGGGRR